MVAQSQGFDEVANCIKYDPERVHICMAAKNGDWDVTLALLRQKISINTRFNVKSDNGAVHHELYSPLIAATSHGHYKYLQVIYLYINMLWLHIILLLVCI